MPRARLDSKSLVPVGTGAGADVNHYIIDHAPYFAQTTAMGSAAMRGSLDTVRARCAADADAQRGARRAAPSWRKHRLLARLCAAGGDTICKIPFRPVLVERSAHERLNEEGQLDGVACEELRGETDLRGSLDFKEVRRRWPQAQGPRRCAGRRRRREGRLRVSSVPKLTGWAV